MAARTRRGAPGQALRLAEQNWTVQRSPQDMRIFLEAALTAHESQAAQPVLATLARSQLQDPAIRGLTAQIVTARQRSPELAEQGDHDP